MDVHSPETSDQVHGDEYRTKGGQLRQNVVDLVISVRHLDRDLGEIVGMRAGKDLLVVVQTLGHRDQVVLDVGEIKSLEVLSSGMTKPGGKQDVQYQR